MKKIAKRLTVNLTTKTHRWLFTNKSKMNSAGLKMQEEVSFDFIISNPVDKKGGINIYDFT
jgi:hypothetical protein